jgi:hypothetical protein
MPSGTMKAIATVRVGPVIVRDCKVIQKPGGAAWVGLPQRPVGSGWAPLVTIADPDTFTRLRDIVLAACAGVGR